MRMSFPVFLLLAVALPCVSHAAVPSDTSVRELVSLMGNKHLLEQEMSQMQKLMNDSMKQALAGQHLSPGASGIMDETNARIMALMRKDMSWDAIEPMMIATYKKTFTQKEVDGMIQFYSSDVGRSVVNKMPIVLRESVRQMQERMKTMMPALFRIEHESIDKLTRAAAKKHRNGS